MFALIAVLCPSLVGIGIFDYFEKNTSNKERIYIFNILMLVSTFINILISFLFFNIKHDMYLCLNTLSIFWCKYVLVSVIVNVVLSFVMIVMKRDVSFEIEVKKDETKGK